MYLVKLDATDSTNQYLKDLALRQTLEDFTVVVTQKQHKGKGQLGNVWQSEPGMNLTASVLKKFDNFKVSDQFLLNIRTSLVIYEVLESYGVPELRIKWPNDILSGTSKICGILIENVLIGDRIKSSVIGIGLNVNQLSFEQLPHVSSLKLILGRTINLENLLGQLITQLEISFAKDTPADRQIIHESYDEKLFRKDELSKFKNAKGEEFTGIIRGINQEGLLNLELEDQSMNVFRLKEIQLLY